MALFNPVFNHLSSIFSAADNTRLHIILSCNFLSQFNQFNKCAFRIYKMSIFHTLASIYLHLILRILCLFSVIYLCAYMPVFRSTNPAKLENRRFLISYMHAQMDILLIFSYFMNSSFFIVSFRQNAQKRDENRQASSVWCFNTLMRYKGPFLSFWAQNLPHQCPAEVLHARHFACFWRIFIHIYLI